MEYTSGTLLDLGFKTIGSWQLADGGVGIRRKIDVDQALSPHASMSVRNALYAFVVGNDVRYIGKTARTIAERLAGYENPGTSQRTNWRCSIRIRGAISSGQQVSIFVFNPIADLRYQDFELNLAAGLEDSLIARFNPPWNGRERNVPISEESEREQAENEDARRALTGDADSLAAEQGERRKTAVFGMEWIKRVFRSGSAGPGRAEEVVVENADRGHDMSVLEPPEVTAVDKPAPQTSRSPVPLAIFNIRLQQAYYNQGIINPGAEASRYLGEHDAPLTVRFSDRTRPVQSRINRTANPGGYVRVVGGNARIKEWFNDHFSWGEIVEGRVLNASEILLMSKKTSG